jgi:catechol 2,3-dioxygenase-like lactoylglutathione lyase family enzyme
MMLSALAAVAMSGARRADGFEAPGSAPSGIGGWREALVVVPDVAPWIETLTVVGGWEVVHHGEPDRALNALWSLPSGARSRQVLMRNIGADTGFIRLVEVSGADQAPIRPDDQAWETGGVSALDLRVVDIEATRAALWRRGWRGPSDPVRYEAYPGIEVIQWAPVSPDGVRLSFIQRLAPPLTGWPELKRWSRAANAAMTVKDMAPAERFFGAVLGLTPAGVSHAVGGQGPNVMGLPWSFARTLAIDIHGYRAAAGHDGSVELICMPAAQGRDFAAAARPPNLGLAGLRFVVADAAALQARLTAAGVAPAAPLQVVAAPPEGHCRIFAVRAPDGAWLEFAERLA